MFRIGSLFSGSGGFELAATLCGMEPIWASEIEPFPIRVTTKRFPHMKHYGDISSISGSDLEPVDLITGGSPCQDMSVAGKRKGMSKECPKCGYKSVANEDTDTCPECGSEMQYTRSGLFMEQIRIVKEMRQADELARLQSGRTDEHIRPRFMLWENVVGAFSSNKGEDFRAVLEETAKVVDETAIIPRPPKGKWNTEGCIVGDGWSIAWRVLDAQFWGVPQRRRRIALVADFAGQCAGEILFKREGLSRNFTESRKEGKTASGDIAKGTDASGEHCVDEQYAVDFGRVADRIQMNATKAVTLQGLGGGSGAKTGLYCLPNDTPPVTMQVRCGNPNGGGKGALLQINKSATLSCGVPQTLFDPQKKVYGICSYGSNSMKSDNPHSGIYEADTARTLEQHAVAYGFEQKAFGKYDESGKASRLKSRDYKDATDLIVEPSYIVRRLTPVECARLQGFPDWWLDGLGTEEPTGHDIAFWREVFETHRKVVTGAKKPKTDKQIIKWLQNPYSDGAAYKLWGNGIALPCFLYVMEGIKEILDRTSTDNHETKTTENVTQ